MFLWNVKLNENMSRTVQAETGYEAANAWLEEQIKAGTLKTGCRYFLNVTRMHKPGEVHRPNNPAESYSVIASPMFRLTATRHADGWPKPARDEGQETEFVYHSMATGQNP